MMLVVDDALPNPDRVLENAATREFGEATGPDGKTYAGVSFDVPGWVAGPLYTRIRELVGRVEPTFLFYRVSVAGTQPPQWAHADSKLCDAMAVVYLTKTPPPHSGTALLEHESGLDRHPETPAEYALWERDHSNASKWLVRDFVPMKFNRMAIISARHMHAAMPAAGFGEGTWNGRLVLITFFRKLGD